MSAVPNLSDEGDAAHGGRERVALAEALFCPSGDMAKVLNEALVLPSVPTVQLVVAAVGRVKEEIYRLLEMAARLEEAARQGEQGGDAPRVVYCSGQVVAYVNAAEHLAEVLVDAFDLWKQYDTRDVPEGGLHDRAVRRYRQVKEQERRPSVG